MEYDSYLCVLIALLTQIQNPETKEVMHMHIITTVMHNSRELEFKHVALLYFIPNGGSQLCLNKCWMGGVISHFHSLNTLLIIMIRSYLVHEKSEQPDQPLCNRMYEFIQRWMSKYRFFGRYNVTWIGCRDNPKQTEIAPYDIYSLVVFVTVNMTMMKQMVLVVMMIVYSLKDCHLQ